MRKSNTRFALLLALLAFLASTLLTACYTMEGFGRDLQGAGRTITNTAEDNNPYR